MKVKLESPRVMRFRVWHRTENRMYYGPIMVGGDLERGFVVVVPKQGVPLQTEPVARYEIMQFTGMRDSESKDIFEGDVVKLNKETIEKIGARNEHCLVGYNRGSFMINKASPPAFMDTNLWHVVDKSEVVGNIFENPELLELTSERATLSGLAIGE